MLCGCSHGGRLCCTEDRLKRYDLRAGISIQNMAHDSLHDLVMGEPSSQVRLGLERSDKMTGRTFFYEISLQREEGPSEVCKGRVWYCPHAIMLTRVHGAGGAPRQAQVLFARRGTGIPAHSCHGPLWAPGSPTGRLRPAPAGSLGLYGPRGALQAGSGRLRPAPAGSGGLFGPLYYIYGTGCGTPTQTRQQSFLLCFTRPQHF